MKKLLVILLTAGLLTACGVPPAYETVNDVYTQPQNAKPMQMVLDMPQEAAAPSLQSPDTGAFYQCDGYTMVIQTFASGNLEQTLQNMTGRGKDQLRPIKTMTEQGNRYDFIWTAAGENGLQMGRGCLLDDGNYHYTLSVMADASETGRLRETWQNLFDTCRLIDGDINLNTGS